MPVRPHPNKFPGTPHYFAWCHTSARQGRGHLPVQAASYCQGSPGVCWYDKLLPPLPSGRRQDNAAALSALAGKPRTLQWSDAMVKAFQDAKTTLARATMHQPHSQWMLQIWQTVQFSSSFGVPMDMSSDKGSQFTSQLWASISQLLGTKLHHTTAYHPQSNILVERFHRLLKSALRACLSGPNWMDELPSVLLGIRTAPKEDLGCSSAELVYRSPLTIPGDFIANHGQDSDHSFQL